MPTTQPPSKAPPLFGSKSSKQSKISKSASKPTKSSESNGKGEEYPISKAAKAFPSTDHQEPAETKASLPKSVSSKVHKLFPKSAKDAKALPVKATSKAISGKVHKLFPKISKKGAKGSKAMPTADSVVGSMSYETNKANKAFRIFPSGK